MLQIYSDSKDLLKGTLSDKTLKNRVYEIARNPKHDGYLRILANMVYTFFDKKAGSGAGASVNEELAQEIHRSVIKKRVFARFNDNI